MTNTFAEISAVTKALEGFESLIWRLKKEATDTLHKIPGNKGLAIISVVVVMDQDGCPLVWIVEDGKKIEPGRKAEDFIRKIFRKDVDVVEGL